MRGYTFLAVLVLIGLVLPREGLQEPQGQTSSWISLDREYYEVNETDTFLEIKLLRRGYLRETSFVGIKAVNGTAVIIEDFRARSPSKVYFNPGQEMGSWRVRMIDDDSYEQAEFFEVILYDAVMSTLEYPESALVQILDEEDDH